MPQVSCRLDYFPGPSDRSVDIEIPFSLAPMVFPTGSLREETLPYLLIGVSSSSQGKCKGEVGLGFVGTKVVASGNSFGMTHRPPWGWMGKRTLRRRCFCREELWDVCETIPINPDEVGERILSRGGTVFLLSIAESGTSSPTVMGMSRRIALHFLEPDPFFFQGQGSFGVNPDLEIAG